MQVAREVNAMRAFELVTHYDAEITRWFGIKDGGTAGAFRFIEVFDRGTLRYGENPHQWATLSMGWRGRSSPDLVLADVKVKDQVECEQAISFNNYGDADAALALCSELARTSPFVAPANSRCE